MNKEEIKILLNAMMILGTIGNETYKALLKDGCSPVDTADGLFNIILSEQNR